MPCPMCGALVAAMDVHLVWHDATGTATPTTD